MIDPLTYIVLALCYAVAIFQIYRATRLWRNPNLLKNNRSGLYALEPQRQERILEGKDPEKRVSFAVVRRVLFFGQVPFLKDLPADCRSVIVRSRLQIIMSIGWSLALILVYLYIFMYPETLTAPLSIINIFMLAVFMILGAATFNAFSLLRVVLIHYWLCQQCGRMPKPITAEQLRQKKL